MKYSYVVVLALFALASAEEKEVKLVSPLAYASYGYPYAAHVAAAPYAAPYAYAAPHAYAAAPHAYAAAPYAYAAAPHAYAAAPYAYAAPQAYAAAPYAAYHYAPTAYALPAAATYGLNLDTTKEPSAYLPGTYPYTVAVEKKE